MTHGKQSSRSTRRKDISRTLIESQEAERKRIAGELHDSLEQDLLVIRNHAVLALREVRVDGALMNSLNEILAASSSAIQEVRAIAANLRPHQLDRLGLTRALSAMVRNVSTAAELEIVADLDELSGTLSADFETHVYRIVQESLNNVVKHSRASLVKVSLKKSSKRVSVRVRDDGCGFPVREFLQLSGNTGFGLLGIAERARILNATFSVISRKGRGTTIRVDVPRVLKSEACAGMLRAG